MTHRLQYKAVQDSAVHAIDHSREPRCSVLYAAQWCKDRTERVRTTHTSTAWHSLPAGSAQHPACSATTTPVLAPAGHPVGWMPHIAPSRCGAQPRYGRQTGRLQDTDLASCCARAAPAGTAVARCAHAPVVYPQSIVRRTNSKQPRLVPAQHTAGMQVSRGPG